MQLENRQKEYNNEDSLKLVKRDRLIAANMASEERVENKRCFPNYTTVNSL